MFDFDIGIDYSGAETADSRIKGLQVYAAAPNEARRVVRCAASGRNWSRRELPHWLRLRNERRLAADWLDHGFSVPLSFFRPYHLHSWPEFLEDFCRYWSTVVPQTSVNAVRTLALSATRWIVHM